MTTLTVKQAAKRFSVEPNTILRWIHAGRLRAYKLPGGRMSNWRIPIEAVEEIENTPAARNGKEEAV